MSGELTKLGRQYILSGKAIDGVMVGYPTLKFERIADDVIYVTLGMMDENDNLLFTYKELFAVPVGASMTLKSGEGTKITFEADIRL